MLSQLPTGRGFDDHKNVALRALLISQSTCNQEFKKGVVHSTATTSTKSQGSHPRIGTSNYIGLAKHIEVPTLDPEYNVLSIICIVAYVVGPP